MIQLIIRALQFSLELNIEYNKSDIIYPYEPRPIRPEALAMRKSRTPYGLDEYYLIAYCFSRKDFRTFKLSRIHKGLSPEKLPFQPIMASKNKRNAGGTCRKKLTPRHSSWKH
ncbi:MAG: WYL domain-containing protein [Lentisphaeria bacterium]|nr:WYL domain-containing protein [Lentisphaeria bacterium]